MISGVAQAVRAANTQRVDRPSEQPAYGVQHLLQNRIYIDLMNLVLKHHKSISAQQISTYHLKSADTTCNFQSGDIVCLDRNFNLIMPNQTAIPMSFLVINDGQSKFGDLSVLAPKGHWCTGVGVAQVRVDDTVLVGQLIGSKMNGTGCGQVVSAPHSAIGFALESCRMSSPKKVSIVRILVAQDPSLLTKIHSCLIPQEKQLWAFWKVLERSVKLLCAENADALETLERFRQEVFPCKQDQSSCDSPHASPILPRSTTNTNFFIFGLPAMAKLGNLDFQHRVIPNSAEVKCINALGFLRTCLGQEHGRIFSIHGNSGVGKTTLVSALVFQLQNEMSFSPILWMDATNVTTLCKCFVVLAQRIIALQGTPMQGRKVGALETVNSWLAANKGWIMILDNVTERSDIDLIKLPYHCGKVVLTTRIPRGSIKQYLKDPPHVDHSIVLGPFEPIEAALLLRRSTGCSESEATSLSSKLEYFPLTIGITIAYLRDRKIKVSQLIADLDRRQLQSTKISGIEHEGTVFPAFFHEIVCAQAAGLRVSNPSACYTLLLCSFLHSKQIRIVLADPQMQSVHRSAVLRLVQLSLLSDGDFKSETTNMHELIQCSIRCWLKHGPDAMIGCGFPHFTARAYSQVPSGANIDVSRHTYSDCLDRVADVLKSLLKMPSAGGIATLAPHLLSVVEHGCHDIQIMDIASKYLHDVQRDPQKSLELRQMVLNAQMNAISRENIDQVIETLFGIAQMNEVQGKPIEAIKACENVLGVLHRYVGESPARYREEFKIKALDALGHLHLKTGKLQTAQSRFEESLSLKEKGFGRGNACIILALQNVARACYMQGYYEVALERWKRALNMIREFDSLNYLEQSKLLSLIGLVLVDLQRYDEAMLGYQSALSLVLQAGIPAFGHLAIVHARIAKVYHCTGRYEEAILQHREALRMQRLACNGADDVSIIRILDDLAYATSIVGKHEDSNAFLRESLAIKKRIFAGDPEYIARCEASLGTQLHGLKGQSGAIEACSLGPLNMSVTLDFDCSDAFAKLNLASKLSVLDDLAHAEHPHDEHDPLGLQTDEAFDDDDTDSGPAASEPSSSDTPTPDSASGQPWV